jgi:hypothetical protein
LEDHIFGQIAHSAGHRLVGIGLAQYDEIGKTRHQCQCAFRIVGHQPSLPGTSTAFACERFVLHQALARLFLHSIETGDQHRGLKGVNAHEARYSRGGHSDQMGAVRIGERGGEADAGRSVDRQVHVDQDGFVGHG